MRLRKVKAVLGRVTAVATEFPFREVMGVELSSALAEVARANTAKIARRFQDRPRVTIAEANVIDFALPSGKLVFFTYHAFGPELIAQMIAKIEAALGAAACLLAWPMRSMNCDVAQTVFVSWQTVALRPLAFAWYMAISARCSRDSRS
jgi:hypothetical protein